MDRSTQYSAEPVLAVGQAHPSVSEQNREKFESVNPYARSAEICLEEHDVERAQVWATLAVAFQKWAQR